MTDKMNAAALGYVIQIHSLCELRVQRKFACYLTR